MGKTEKSFFQKYRCPLVTGGVLLILAFIFSSQCPPKPTPVITLADGKVQGIVQYSRNGSEYWSFRGIPYGRPPLKELRFTPPLPNLPWKGVLKATKFAPHCKLYDAMIFHDVQGSEDCLYLNVFAHPIEKNKSRPVMIYVVGGAFVSGGASIYHADYVMDSCLPGSTGNCAEGHVVVTFNYRLGPFGFLNLETKDGDGSLPRGNQGLKDQVLLLKWVQKNIHSFGGDPTRVTLFGQSAGAVSTHLHILSPASRGLFHKAILQSGSAFCPWGFSSRPREVSLNYVEKVGCPTGDRKEMLSCLQKVDADELVKQQISLTVLDMENGLLLPSVERYKADDIFLGEWPGELARKGEFPKVPAIFGMNRMEAAFRTARFDALDDDEHIIPLFESDTWTQYLNYFLGYTNITANMAQVIRDRYFGNMSFAENPQVFKDRLTILATYSTVFEQIDRASMFHAKAGAKTFKFFYTYRNVVLPSVYSIYKAVQPNDWLPSTVKVRLVVFKDWIKEHFLGYVQPYAPVHGDELGLLWNLEGESKLMSYFEKDFSEDFVRMIMEFVYKESLSFRGTEFEPVDMGKVEQGEKLRYMLLDNSKGNGKIIEDPFAEGLQFWRNLGVENFSN